MRQPCKAGCGRPKKKGKHFCEWHWLERQSSDVQAEAARARLRVYEDMGLETRARVPKSEWPLGHRWCAGCQSFVPLFYTSGSRCKACASMAAHERRLEQTYGIDGDEYRRIMAVQGGRCAICQNRPASIRFAVDHDHQTGEVRGILCKRCNHDLLGAAHDDVTMLWRALSYLLAPPASNQATPDFATLVEALQERLRVAGRMGRTRYVEPPREAPF